MTSLLFADILEACSAGAELSWLFPFVLVAAKFGQGWTFGEAETLSEDAGTRLVTFAFEDSSKKLCVLNGQSRNCLKTRIQTVHSFTSRLACKSCNNDDDPNRARNNRTSSP